MNKKCFMLIVLMISAGSTSSMKGSFVSNILITRTIVSNILITRTIMISGLAYAASCVAETVMLPQEEKYNERRNELIDQFKVSFAIAAGAWACYSMIPFLDTTLRSIVFSSAPPANINL
jgi:hypothetical protein